MAKSDWCPGSSEPVLGPSEVEDCARMLARGAKVADLASKYDVSTVTVYNAMRRHGLPVSSVRHEHRTKSRTARSLPKAEQITALHQQGMSAQEICKALGCTRAQASEWLIDAGMPGFQVLNRQRREAHGITDERLRAKARRLSAYGITLREYDAMLARQGNKCAACGGPLGPERTRKNEKDVGGTFPVVDHCHRTDDDRASVRGILHSSCNVILGLSRDDPEKLKRIARYASETRATRPMKPSPKPQGLPGLH